MTCCRGDIRFGRRAEGPVRDIPIVVLVVTIVVRVLLFVVWRRHEERVEEVLRVAVALESRVHDKGGLDAEDTVVVFLVRKLVPVDGVLPEVLRKAHLTLVQLACKKRKKTLF